VVRPREPYALGEWEVGDVFARVSLRSRDRLVEVSGLPEGDPFFVCAEALMVDHAAHRKPGVVGCVGLGHVDLPDDIKTIRGASVQVSAPRMIAFVLWSGAELTRASATEQAPDGSLRLATSGGSGRAIAEPCFACAALSSRRWFAV
jgi:hypothetical protein